MLIFTKALDIDCVFGIIPWLGIGNLYSCTVKSSQIASNGTYITEFTGTHVSGYSNENVQGIYFANNCHHIEYIPLNFQKYFPNFIGLCMNRCGISKLSGNELNFYRNLQAIL